MFIENISVFQKSSTNQGEIDILWEKCDTQKKMIRTLHDEVDNTRNDFNKKLEKYKVSRSNGQQVHQYQQTNSHRGRGRWIYNYLCLSSLTL